MLQGLGKNLRRCGIDTAILENQQDHKDCVKYALDEKRYILTRKGTFIMVQHLSSNHIHVKNIYFYNFQLNGYVPAGHCLRIASDHVDEQLQEVLEYYKVVVTKNHIFSRCMVSLILRLLNGNFFLT